MERNNYTMSALICLQSFELDRSSADIYLPT